MVALHHHKKIAPVPGHLPQVGDTGHQAVLERRAGFERNQPAGQHDRPIQPEHRQRSDPVLSTVLPGLVLPYKVPVVDRQFPGWRRHDNQVQRSHVHDHEDHS